MLLKKVLEIFFNFVYVTSDDLFQYFGSAGYLQTNLEHT